MIQRRHSVPVKVGNVTIGGESPVAVQCMTDTDTANIDATVQQTIECVNAGAELVRFTVYPRAMQDPLIRSNWTKQLYTFGKPMR